MGTGGILSGKYHPWLAGCPESIPPGWRGVRRVSPLAGGVSGKYPPGVRKVSPQGGGPHPPGWGTAPPRVGDHTPWHDVLKDERFVSTKRYFLKQMMKHPPGVRKVSPLAGECPESIPPGWRGVRKVSPRCPESIPPVSGKYPPRVGDRTPQSGGPHPPGWGTTPPGMTF